MVRNGKQVISQNIQTQMENIGDITDIYQRREKKRMGLLTGSNSSSTSSTGLGGTAAKGEEPADPSEGQLAALTVKVGCHGVGCTKGLDLAIVGRVTDGQEGFNPAGAGCDGATVDEAVEAGTTTVSAVATLADTAEGKGGDVQGSVVDGDTTGAGSRDN